jgi:hypothetical protein
MIRKQAYQRTFQTSHLSTRKLGICGYSAHGMCNPIHESNQLPKHYNRF